VKKKRKIQRTYYLYDRKFRIIIRKDKDAWVASGVDCGICTYGKDLIEVGWMIRDAAELLWGYGKSKGSWNPITSVAAAAGTLKTAQPRAHGKEKK
jgi:hypothetical protein